MLNVAARKSDRTTSSAPDAEAEATSFGPARCPAVRNIAAIGRHGRHVNEPAVTVNPAGRRARRRSAASE
ncbi:hypothetical protein GCM10009679_67880 [Saccharothrix algeriensis]|uniref:Uncharacterized protein n=1 Tax=Catellatospora bangladeshensis TaxID=310355 RepID=A0A8J3JP84_9ACTN|nr:hypothetical protein Cba03nite_57400 [Catellatospora bangladeshensis]